VQDLTVLGEFRAELTGERSSRSSCAAVASQSNAHCRSNTHRIQRDRAGKPAVQKPWVSRADSRVRTWVKSRFFVRGKRSRRSGDGGRGRFARSNLPTREQDGASALLLTCESTAVEAPYTPLRILDLCIDDGVSGDTIEWLQSWNVSWIVFRRWLMPNITPARACDTQIHAHPPKEGLMGYRISRRLGLNPSRIRGTKSGRS